MAAGEAVAIAADPQIGMKTRNLVTHPESDHSSVRGLASTEIVGYKKVPASLSE